MSTTTAEQPVAEFDAHALARPAPVLLRYYVFISLLSAVGFPFVFLPLFFRYHTLRFKFDADGISVSWGILFRREVQLTYRRIQDIHVTRNFLQRWMGLSNVEVQTASGSSGAEMVIEGVLEADALRDFLYRKMRGARGDEEPLPSTDPVASASPDEALVLLREIRDELRGLRNARQSGDRGTPQ